MGRRPAIRASNVARGAVWLMGMCVPMAAYAQIPARLGWQMREQPRQRSRWASGSFEELPLRSESDRDVILLKNGDFLSGEVLAIGQESVHFDAEMVEGTVKVPLAALKRLEFSKSVTKESGGSDEIALVGEGRFRASVTGMDGTSLSFRTVCSGDSPEVKVAIDKVACIALGCEPLVLLREEFEGEAGVSFVGDQGEWVVHRGQFLFLQIDPNQYTGKAYARVRQWGRMRYLWTVDSTRGSNAGLYILASDRRVMNDRGNAYRIQLENNRIALYKATEHGETQSFLCQSVPVRPRASFEVRYDCGCGLMGIWLDGQQIANLRDQSPIASGEYVILRGDGRAAFEDVRVENLGGEMMLSQEEKKRDMVVLKNGDKILGNVTEVSEQGVLVTGNGGESETKIDRGKVSWIVFGGRSSAAAKGKSVVFWDDSRLTATVRSLEGGILVVENETVGKLSFDPARVKAIVLEE